MSPPKLTAQPNHDTHQSETERLLEQLASRRKKLDSGELCLADLAAWNNPLVAVSCLEASLLAMDVISDLRSEVNALHEQNMELRANLALISEALLDSTDADAGDVSASAGHLKRLN